MKRRLPRSWLTVTLLTLEEGQVCSPVYEGKGQLHVLDALSRSKGKEDEERERKGWDAVRC